MQISTLCLVESERGAVAVGRTYLLPPLSFGGASLAKYAPVERRCDSCLRLRAGENLTLGIGSAVEGVLDFAPTLGVAAPAV
jgi:hypothetical protein